MNGLEKRLEFKHIGKHFPGGSGSPVQVLTDESELDTVADVLLTKALAACRDLDVPRLLLHACMLELVHPCTGAHMRWDCPTNFAVPTRNPCPSEGEISP